MSVCTTLYAQTPPPAAEPSTGEPGLVTIREFLANAPAWGEAKRVRLRGTVTHTISDRTYFIQDGGAGVYVFHKPEPAFHAGQVVEVIGHPSLGGLVPTLQNCEARVIGEGRLPEPERITSAQALAGGYAMKLVRMSGRLVERQLMGGRLLVLRPTDGGQSFQVNFEAVESFEFETPPEQGSLLEVSGVLVLRAGPDRKPAGLTVLVRSAEDVIVLAGPPFWTLRHLGLILGGTGVALVLALVWVLTLRRQVARQTRLVEQRLKREAALKALEERFAKVFRASPDAIVISRAKDDRVLDANPAFETLCGLGHAEIVGRTEDSLSLWFDPEARPEALRRLDATGSLSNYECALRGRGPEGTLSCLYSAEWIELNGERCRLGVFRDVSERKRREEERHALQSHLQQAQKMESLGTLAGGIAHDFNNLLAAILGNAELAREDTSLPAAVRDSLSEISVASLRGRDLVQRILTFSRQQPHSLQPTSLGPVIAEAARLLRAGIPAAIEIEVRVDPDCPPALADATQIHQVIMNLGTNAWHAMEGRPGRMTFSLRGVNVDADLVSQHPDLHPGLYACLSVADQGVGISATLRERIFDPFFTLKEPGKGTGLGLAAVHGIVKGHGGAIVVESEPERGATFYVYLPAAGAKPEASTPFTVPDVSPLGAGREVLLIDDQESVRSVATRMLERLGFLVTASADPVEALVMLQRAPGRFQFVLTDLSMPGMTGLELVAALRARGNNVPVVLASGQLSDDLRDRVLAAGANRVVQKPLTVAELATAVRGLTPA